MRFDGDGEWDGLADFGDEGVGDGTAHALFSLVLPGRVFRFAVSALFHFNV